jgi:hypothetical protein
LTAGASSRKLSRLSLDLERLRRRCPERWRSSDLRSSISFRFSSFHRFRSCSVAFNCRTPRFIAARGSLTSMRAFSRSLRMESSLPHTFFSGIASGAVAAWPPDEYHGWRPAVSLNPAALENRIVYWSSKPRRFRSASASASAFFSAFLFARSGNKLMWPALSKRGICVSLLVRWEARDSSSRLAIACAASSRAILMSLSVSSSPARRRLLVNLLGSSSDLLSCRAAVSDDPRGDGGGGGVGTRSPRKIWIRRSASTSCRCRSSSSSRALACASSRLTRAIFSGL